MVSETPPRPDGYSQPITAYMRALRRFLESALVLTALSAVWTVLLSLFTPEIRDSTRLFLIGPRGGPDWLVTAFWLTTALWLILVYHRFQAESAEQRHRLDRLLGAIHRAPSANPIKKYREWFDTIAKVLHNSGPYHKWDTEKRLKHLEASLQAALQLIAGLAQEFTAAPDSQVYGANIMLVATPEPDGTYPKEIVDHLIFFDKKLGRVEGLRCLLYLPKPLLYAGKPPLLSNSTQTATAPTRLVPLISLPVPQTLHHENSKYKLALFGAPWALLEGQPSIQEDTRKLADQSVDFDSKLRDEIRRYFNDDGAGSQVRSFASFRIGFSDRPVGVLNIDCNAPYLLGTDAEFYATFYALIVPILRLLMQPVTEFASLARESGTFFREGDPSTVAIDVSNISLADGGAAGKGSAEAGQSA